MDKMWAIIVVSAILGAFVIYPIIRALARRLRPTPPPPPPEPALNIEEAKKLLGEDRTFLYQRHADVTMQIRKLERQIKQFQRQRVGGSPDVTSGGLSALVCDEAFAMLVLANLETIEKLQAHLQKLSAMISACKRLLVDVDTASDLSRPFFFKRRGAVDGLGLKITEAVNELQRAFEAVDKTSMDSEFALRMTGLGEVGDRREMEKKLKHYEENGMLARALKPELGEADPIETPTNGNGQGGAKSPSRVSDRVPLATTALIDEDDEDDEKPVDADTMANELSRILGLRRATGESTPRLYSRVRNCLKRTAKLAAGGGGISKDV